MIREAVIRDLPVLLEIYNDAILHSTATFDLEPKTIEERMEWFAVHKGKYVLLVCEMEGRIAGYASLSPYRNWEAYEGTAELSVYVAASCRNRGIGAALVDAVLSKARAMGELHTVVSVITEGNEASRRLHEKFQFSYCGCVKEAGKKFGQYLGVETYQVML